MSLRLRSEMRAFRPDRHNEEMSAFYCFEANSCRSATGPTAAGLLVGRQETVRSAMNKGEKLPIG